MSPVTPDRPSRPGGVRADDRPVDRAAPARRVPAPRAGESPRGRAPLPVAAGVAAGWAALTSYLPVAIVLALVQLGADGATLGGALRTALAGWLVGHGVPLHTEAGPFGLAPLALTVLAIWRLTRAGVHVSRAIGARDTRSPRRALLAACAVGVAYALLGALAAVLVGAGGPNASPIRAAATFAAVGTLAALVGATRITAVTRLLVDRMPARLRDGVRTGLVAGLLLLGAGAGAAGLAVATGGGDAADMIGAYRTGVAGQAGITLVSVAYAPNAAIWSTSYLLGPGFAVGTDTAVRTSEVSVGALPAVPLLAGLPRGPVDGLGALLLAVPVLAGMVAGWLLARRTARHAGPERARIADAEAQHGRERASRRWADLLVPAALAGPVAGVLLGVAAKVSAGPLGAGRLTQLGPVAWQVAVVATGVIGVGALLGAAATRALTRPSAP
ncbi:cell division protein PerM [Micromonospora orduensis]|uniref:cell division protein PerM n=1 Tax=Micromonospora orduensis TaxID=1420891 RepID=UPI0033D0BC15